MHLITGYSGEAHITSANDGEMNAHVFGAGKYVFNSRNKFSATIVSNNIVRIASGEGILNGRYFEIANNSTENVSIDNGTAGTNRIDLIVARYQKDGETNIETMSLKVIKGTPASTPSEPAYNSGSVLDGVATADFPLYRVNIEGISLKSVQQKFTIKNDILTDVQSENASTISTIQTNNANTVTAVQNSNASTLASIKADNDTTVAEIEALVEDIPVTSVIYTNPDESATRTSYSYSNISSYSYIEIIYYIAGSSSNRYFSTGKLPLDSEKYSDGVLLKSALTYNSASYNSTAKKYSWSIRATEFIASPTSLTLESGGSVTNSASSVSEGGTFSRSSGITLQISKIIAYK